MPSTISTWGSTETCSTRRPTPASNARVEGDALTVEAWDLASLASEERRQAAGEEDSSFGCGTGWSGTTTRLAVGGADSRLGDLLPTPSTPLPRAVWGPRVPWGPAWGSRPRAVTVLGNRRGHCRTENHRLGQTGPNGSGVPILRVWRQALTTTTVEPRRPRARGRTWGAAEAMMTGVWKGHGLDRRAEQPEHELLHEPCRPDRR